MDKAIFLQRQIKENSEDFQKELRDMEAWEEQMKKKDLEIRSSKDDKVLPPVRCKKKKKAASNSQVTTDEKPKKTKRIGACDYDSWDKFDVTEACKEIEGSKDSTKEKVEKVYEIASEEELEKEHAEATKLKEEGNMLVQKQEYAKAVGKYSEAIKVFPHDAVFYANRALCQIKLDNLYAAESDCTTAIKLNEKYLKAYHRRATARMELKRFNDALKDVEVVLKLEPGNKEAMCMFKQLQKIVQKKKPMVISGEQAGDTSSIEKKIGEKLLGKSSSKKKTIKEENKEDGNLTAVDKDQSSIEMKFCKKEVSTVPKSSCPVKSEQISENNNFPAWLPKLKEDVSIVKTIAGTPAQRKQKLKKVLVKEIAENESIFKDIVKEVKKVKVTESITVEKNNVQINKVDKKPKIEESDKTENIAEVLANFPPAPKTSVAFILNWRKNVSPDFRYKYLKQITPDDLPDIFKESMESSIFSEILTILHTKFLSNNDNVYEILRNLAKVKRFRALILFMTEEDKKALKELFNYCGTKEAKSDAEVKELYSIYEM